MDIFKKFDVILAADHTENGIELMDIITTAKYDIKAALELMKVASGNESLDIADTDERYLNQCVYIIKIINALLPYLNTSNSTSLASIGDGIKVKRNFFKIRFGSKNNVHITITVVTKRGYILNIASTPKENNYYIRIRLTKKIYNINDFNIIDNHFSHDSNIMNHNIELISVTIDETLSLIEKLEQLLRAKNVDEFILLYANILPVLDEEDKNAFDISQIIIKSLYPFLDKKFIPFMSSETRTLGLRLKNNIIIKINYRNKISDDDVNLRGVRFYSSVFRDVINSREIEIKSLKDLKQMLADRIRVRRNSNTP